MKVYNTYCFRKHFFQKNVTLPTKMSKITRTFLQCIPIKHALYIKFTRFPCVRLNQ